MIVYHITGVGNALSILRSGIFNPHSLLPTNGDNGLNSFDHRVGYTVQRYKSQQCIIFFDCSLPYSVTSVNTPNPLPPGVLHDQYPWRMFIRGPINKLCLRITNVRIRKWAIDEYLSETEPSLVPSFIIRLFYRKRRLRLLTELRSLYRSKPAYIEVAF